MKGVPPEIPVRIATGTAVGHAGDIGETVGRRIDQHAQGEFPQMMAKSRYGGGAFNGLTVGTPMA